MNTYEDMLVTDIERIKRAKEIMRNPLYNRRDRIEAIQLLALYRKLSNENINSEQKERAKEIAYELGNDY